MHIFNVLSIADEVSVGFNYNSSLWKNKLQGTISEELDSLGLTTLLQLLEDTGLIDTLEGLGMLLDART